jgi:alpha-2-macroglobulin
MLTRLRIALCVLLVLLQSLGLFTAQIATGQTRRASTSLAQGGDVKTGLQLRLSESTPVADSQPVVSAAPAARLSEDDAQRVLKRLQPLKAEPSDEQAFALRDRSLPPPRTGRTITDSSPPPERLDAPESVAAGPLEVIRYSPEGDVPLVPQLSVTFSQPMVAVTSHQDTIAAGVPVKLTPQPPGHWRWVGTKTLLFETEGHFPMATEYTAEIPAGVKSATGAILAAPKRWKFTTPPPVVKSSYPNDGPTTRDPLMFVEFDQRINPAAVIDTIRVRSGNRDWKARLATSEEVAGDETVSELAAHATKDRWLAFRVVNSGDAIPRAPLPVGSPINVTIGTGAPSAEGPRTTAAPQSLAFRTYGPLRVTEHRCGYREACSPFDQWSIQFTNPIDTSGFEQSQVRVEEISVSGKKSLPVSLKSAIYGNTLNISGIKRGRTSYRVTIDPAIRDQFGQTLGQTAPIVFNVGSAPAALAGPDKQFVVLDPAAPPRFSVYSINHSSLRVRLYSVGPEHWNQLLAYMRGRDDQTPRTPPGRLALSKIISVTAKPDEMAETRIDLSPVLNEGVGQVFIVVEPVVPTARRYRDSVAVWAQVTQIGLDAFVDSAELVGWATSLKDGKPIDGAQISVEVAQATSLRSETAATTSADGIAHIPLSSGASKATRILVAHKGRDVAILPENTWWSDQSGWVKKAPGYSLRWFVFDDRKMYRPGEEVHVKGWIRRVGDGKGGDVGLLDGIASSVAYVVTDSRDNEVLKGEARINALGGFDTVFKLPPTMNLGYAHIQLDAHGDGFAARSPESHDFQVQEFRRPEFEVTAQASEGPHFVGGSAITTVNAAYYAGGGLGNAEVTWRVTTSTARFTPPNRDDFTFGTWIPWWIDSSPYTERKVETFDGRTDAAGKHTLRMDFASVNPPQPSTVIAEASVTDVNRQAWTASTNLLVHPADLYVGIRSPRTFVQKGEPLIVQSIVADLDGKLIAGSEIKLRTVLMDWVFEKGQWKQQETNPQECAVKSAATPVECRFETKEGGQYRVTATIQDDRERRNESELTLWVAGGKVVPKRDVEQEDAQMIPDRKDYRAGDTAEILVQAPFYPAEGVLTLRRSGIVSSERFAMDGPSHTLRIPIEEGYTPNLHVQVDLVGAAVRTDNEGAPAEKLPKRPAFAKGELNLLIPPLARKLAVESKPRDKALEPGGETTVDIEVRDVAGKPVAGSEIAVVVVDEAVLALTGYRIGDPIDTFYSQRGADVSDHHLRENVLLAAPEDLAEKLQRTGSNTGGGEARLGGGRGDPAGPRTYYMKAADADHLARLADKEEPAAIRLRQDFNALATFAPAVPTDATGRATVKVKLPDSLTRYRVMAVAVAGGKQFGANESTITARLPLMVRPSAPRFLNFGDKIELPVVVQNQTDSPMDVNIAVRASNAELTAGAGRRVTVPANDRVEVRFPVSAARAGTARFQIAGVSGKWADAAEIELPVWTPATTEAFATYGEIDEGAIVQPVKAPNDAIKQFGGLEISTSSTELQALTDAVIYLVAYPFECSEQLSSRVLAIAALKDVLAAFKAKGLPEPKEMIEAVARDIKRLESRQSEDGGFGFWRRGDQSWPYVSIHVAHAIQRAKEKGFDVPASMLDRSKKYLREIEQHIPGHYGSVARRSLIAYSLYVRNLMGDKDAARSRILIAGGGLDGLSLEGLGWLLSVLSGDPASQVALAAIRKHLNNRATEEAATAHFVTSYKDDDYLLMHSDRRADAVILEALIKDQPASDLIPKLVRGLLAHRKQGRWENTQENAFVLLALDKYFATYEKVTPDFVARAWLGEAYAGGHEFRGRTTERHNVNIPMRALAESGASQNLILSKEGPGRLYYRVGMQYAPASLKLDPSEHGFTVERVYEAVDKADDVRRDADGTWHIKAGARVRVKLTMLVASRRYHVALVDPIPAGLEALNPALAVTGSVPQDPNDKTTDRWWWWQRPWFEHQNMRDERVEAFASLVWEGVHTYSYVARATTPGVFIVPPTKAEEMYHPETFGRSGTDRVIVE